MTLWADRYEILGGLGSGGNGVVYRVRDRKIGRDLALKLMNDGDEVLAVREAHALTALESPHVLRVFNAGVHGDVPFIATEIAVAGSTEDQIGPGVGVAPHLAVRWVRQALVGLDYCHRMNVLHRDLTPGNIFLNSVDHALIGDFGIAANLDEVGTAPAAGNQRSRAPEGFGGRLTVRSEVFSAGATLWRLLTGGWPYDAGTETELAEMMRTVQRPRLRDVAPHVHRSIAAVVEGALHPDPAQRPATAADLAHGLSGCQTHTRNWMQIESAQHGVVYESTAGGSMLVVRVHYEDVRRTIETRHAQSQRRVAAGCLETTDRRLSLELRRLFDSL